MSWVDDHRAILLASLNAADDDVVPATPVWRFEPHVSLWLVDRRSTGARVWELVGSLPRSSEDAAASGRLFDREDPEAFGKLTDEEIGRLPSMLLAEPARAEEPPREALRRFATSRQERLERLERQTANAPRSFDQATLDAARRLRWSTVEILLGWVADDALWVQSPSSCTP